MAYTNLKYLALLVALPLAGATTPYSLKTPPLTTNWTSSVGTSPWPEYPRPQLVRDEWKNLNGVWQFQAASGADELSSPPFGKDLAQSILVPSCIESGLSGIMTSRTFHSWYRTTFNVPKEWNNSKVLLNFGAVDYEATVFINGKNATFHRGGYFRFQVDITEYLNPNGSNEILVFVFDPTETDSYNFPVGKQAAQPSHIFYTACTGIWQSVFLEPANDKYVTRIDVTADMNGKVDIKVLTSSPDVPSQVKIDVQALEGNSTIATASGSSDTLLNFQVSNPSLWSPSSPKLYNILITLSGGDVVHTYTGFRTISKGTVDGVTRPLLNGKFLFQFGTLDQGYWPDGIYTAPTHEAMVYDLKVLKSLGFNMVRKHIKIEPDLYYRACDEAGLLVWQDMPSMSPAHPAPNDAQQAEFTRQLELLINTHKSFPSITTWIIYNEGWGQLNSADVGLTDVVRNLDSSRLINSVSGFYDHGSGDFHDNHHYSSPQCGSPITSLPNTRYDPNRIGVAGEFGGVGHNVSIEHLWNDANAISTIPQTYEMDDTVEVWNYRALSTIGELEEQTRMFSCSAGVYTQTTDVEGEVNGLLTYDRRVLRADVARWTTAISALYAAADSRSGSA